MVKDTLNQGPSIREPFDEEVIMRHMTRYCGAEDLDTEARVITMSLLADCAAAGTTDLSHRVLERLAALANSSPSAKVAHDFFCGHVALRREEYDSARKWATAGRMVALEHHWEAEVAGLTLISGTAALNQGEYHTSLRCFEEAVVAARRADSRSLEGRSVMNLGLALKSCGEIREAERQLRLALNIAAHTHDSALQARSALNLTTVLTRTGAWREALEHALSAAVSFKQRNLSGYANTASLAVARIQRMLGNVLDAASSLREVLAQARDLDKPRNIILALEFLGDCDLDLGDPVASRERYREALLLARGHGKSTDLVLECLRGLGAAELACGEPQTARGLVEESIAIAREQGDSFELGTSLFVLAQVLDALGETGGELEALNESRNLASTIGDDHGHARASLALARQALAEGRRVDAMTLAAEAHRLFQRIGAEHLIAEAAGVLEAISEKGSPVSAPAKPRKPATAATITSDALVPGFITVDPGLLHTLGIVKALAPRRPNILVHGESGTGKELIAQAVHSQSGRTGPFVPVNCSAFPGDLIEGELFGHARGAYTGADRERVGLFEHAHKGTLFLDEIGDMPIKAQARLLRALEGGEVRRLGENTARVVDVRVVAATHRNLMAMVHAGEFRLDLYYRLAGFVVQIPAVRERPDDARLLIDHFLAKFAQEQEKSIALMPEPREELAAHSWPGNVREIRLVMERLVSLTSDGAVLRRLPFRLEGAPRPRSLPEALEAEERRRVLDALTTHNWNKQRAANALGTSRTTLIAKMQRMGIAIQKP